MTTTAVGSIRRKARVVCVLAALWTVLPATAQQYRSEVKELDTPPAQQPQQDAATLLKNTTDPYAKALLLRDLAAEAAQKGDTARASRYLEQALAQNALSGMAADQMRSDLAQLYLSSGDYQKVLPQLEAQVKTGKAPPEVLVALGAAYLEKNRFKDALPLLQKAIAARPKVDPSWRRALAAALIGSGREKDALPHLEQLLKEDPSQREDWIRLVALHAKFGNKPRAAALMELASRLGYLKTAEERLQLVSLVAQVGAPFEAASVLQSWTERKLIPVNAANARLKATLWLAARESGLALTALDEALRLGASPELYRQKAQLHMDREEYPQAAKALEQALASGKPDGNTLLTLGMARYQQADVDGAQEAFQAAIPFAGSRKLAEEWVKYLQTGKAREQALAAAADRRAREAETVRLSGRLTGDSTVTLTAGGGVEAGMAVTSREALTPVGAEAPGNRDGSVAAWEGGLSRAQWPAAFKPGQRLVDPYAGDKPLFTITAANADRYRNQLSEGHRALLARYPTYRMPVYPPRRSVAYPQAIYEATQANIGKSRLQGSDTLQGARLGFPFARPQSGVEVMWNHRTRYRGNGVVLQSTQAVVREGTAPQYLKQTERVWFRYGNIKNPSDLAKDNILLYYLTWFGRSRNEVDFLALVHESATIERPRNIWVLPPKIPRMFRVPPVGYDQPFPGAEGLMFIDMVDMYNGAFDRYVWKLVGKRELYVPYNAYRANDGRFKYAQLLQPRHLNPDATRYELHRVWVIEATERGGKRHSFGKRIFYVDEDSWNVLLVENQDREGRLWRFQEGHLLPAYDVQTANTAPVVTYDLKDGRYFANRLSGEDPPPQYDQPMKDSDFLPAAVKARYAR